MHISKRIKDGYQIRGLYNYPSNSPTHSSCKMTTVQSTAAQLYLENSSLQEDHAAELLTMLDVPQGGLVLDLGCGTGRLATVLSDLVGPSGKVIAVDPDAHRIAVAKKNNERSNIEYSIANDQSFPGEGYDLIVSTHVIHWIKDKKAVFNRIYNKLAPGGTFGFVTYNNTPQFPPAVSRGLSTLVSPDFEYDLLQRKMIFEKEEYYQIVATKARFETASAKIVSKALRFESVSEFLEFWQGVSHGGFDINEISKEKVKRYRQKYEKELRIAVIDLPTLCMTFRKSH